MTKVIEKNVAEILIVLVFLLAMSSCSSVKNTCAAYASIECQNCDEID